ncbi:MAG: hypothetical protein J2P30_22415 [Actinobacteria bacterium]|nr:hypothetical protein [Actinomycetota bacterium]
MPSAPAAPLSPHRRPGRLAIVLLAAFGLVGVAAGGTGLYLELTRGATRAEVAAALREEIATRWQRLPSGTIFPATVSYPTNAGLVVEAHRVGIAPTAPCASALDPAVVKVFRPQGCRVVLRATFVDSSSTVVSTVGVAVMPSTSAAATAAGDLGRTSVRGGVMAVAFPGTPARLFGNNQRVWFYATAVGPYVVLATAGYTSGPYRHRVISPGAFSGLGVDFGSQVTAALARAAKPCQGEDIRC